MGTNKVFEYFFECKKNLDTGKMGMEEFSAVSLKLAQELIQQDKCRSEEESLADRFYDFANLIKEEIFLYWFKQGYDHLRQKPKVPEDFDLYLRNLFKKEIRELENFVSKIKMQEEDSFIIQSAFQF